MPVKLSRSARRDLEDIRKFTLARWGREQWLRYYSGLSAAFGRIATDATCGRPRDTLYKSLRSLNYEQHVVFFYPAKRTGGAVAVVRIVHQRRNLAALSFTQGLEGEG